MNQTMKTLTFDFVAYKRQVQTKIYEAICHLTPEQQRLYFQQGAETGSLGDWWRTLPKECHRNAAA